jgi:hypothetical protein
MNFQIQLNTQQQQQSLPVNQQPRIIKVTVPQGAVAGQTIQLQTPMGQMVKVVIPPNMRPGMMFQVRV